MLAVNGTRLAAASLMARADTRHRIAVRDFIIRKEYAVYDGRAELPRIQCPTLVAVGRAAFIERLARFRGASTAASPTRPEESRT